MKLDRDSEIIRSAKPILEAASYATCIFDTSNRLVYQNEAYKTMVKRGSAQLVSDTKEIIVDGKVCGKVMVYHDISEIKRLKKEIEKMHQKLRNAQVKYTFQDIIGKDANLLRTIQVAKGAATTPATILIQGESGTGKEIFAQAIHNTSNRRNEKLVLVNCSALPEELLESELFGYKEGAFTGAVRGGKKGLFQEANKGTLFLDEIGDISLRMQVKLLRALQEKEIMPLGSTQTIPVDVRIICATNKSLEELIKQGQFREDLYYRINVFPLHIPPLRERVDDIEHILFYLLNNYNEFYNRKVKEIDQEVLVFLKQQEWRGNVRELQNVLLRTLIGMSEEDICIKMEHLMQAWQGTVTSKCTKKEYEIVSLTKAMEEAEKHYIEEALECFGGDKNKASYALGIPIRTLYHKCKKLQICKKLQ